MFEITRRDFIVSSAAAFAALGLPKQVAFLGAASAQARALMEEGFYRFKVGEVEMTTIYDGVWHRDHDPGFIRNATVEDTKAALKAAGLPEDKVSIPFTVVAARTGGKTILFDAGTGGQLTPTAGLLKAKHLAAAGIAPDDVSLVIVTHFHPDHIFGLMEKDTNAPVFKNAEIVVPETEYKFWTDPGVFSQLPEARHGLAKRIQAVFPAWKNVTLIAGEKEVVPGVRAIPAFGHTPGHTIFHVSSGSDQLYVMADVCNIPALFLRNPGWHAAFDSDGKLAEETRRKLFGRVAAEKAMMTGYHFPFPAVGKIEADGNGFAFTPVT